MLRTITFSPITQQPAFSPSVSRVASPSRFSLSKVRPQRPERTIWDS